MRIRVDLGSHMTAVVPQTDTKIIQVERTPTSGVVGASNINGCYVIPVIKGVEFPVDDSSYVLAGAAPGDVDGGDVSSISYAHLLAMYPMFANIYFNPLLTYKHVEEIDLTATFTDKFTAPPAIYQFPTRIQTGRPSTLPVPWGNMPMNTAILPINPNSAVDRPGVLVTNEINLEPHMADGADNFLVYWKLYDFSFTHDVVNGSTNDPAIRSIVEPDQEPDDFKVYLSPDNGMSWCEIGLLEPLGFCDKTKKIRLAFVNRSASKIYLATYAVLF